jgi:hypothetical protein
MIFQIFWSSNGQKMAIFQFKRSNLNLNAAIRRRHLATTHRP